MSATTETPAPAGPTAGPTREPEDVAAELEAARAEFRRMERENAAYHETRASRLARRDRLETVWKRDNPNEPFDPSLFNPPATVPPPDSPVGPLFHKQHYIVARLEKELIAAKRAVTGV